MIAIATWLFIAFYRYFKSEKYSKTTRKARKQDLLDLLDAHATAQEGQERKPKVGYATLAETDDLSEVVSGNSEATELGHNLGLFVFWTTATPLVLAAVFFAIELIIVIINAITLYTFQLAAIPWQAGIGYITFLSFLFPTSIFTGLAMLPFGYRSQFRIGRCETILAIITFAYAVLAAVGVLFGNPFDSTTRTLMLIFSLYVSCLSLFGFMYFVCSLFGLCTEDTQSSSQSRKPQIPFGNWPKQK